MKTRPFQSTISLDDARAIVERTVTPIERTERARLHDARGRVLAREVVSTSDVPPFSRAGMDGYALRAADTAGASRVAPRVLRQIEEVFTGQMPQHSVQPGECTAVATGAPMPSGADAVVMVEDTEDASGSIRVFAAVQPHQNVGKRGADIRSGQQVLPAGALLNASRLGALAAIGLSEADVYARPRVAILSTGNEIVEAGMPLAPGQIYDINTVTLSAVIAEHGGVPVPMQTAADTIEDLSRAVDKCLQHDVLVFSGGSSVGERDLVLDIIQQRGEVLFHGIAVKPGKPTAFARIGSTLAFAMPGYPTSCLSNAYILLAPALRRLARLPAQGIRSIAMPLGARVTSVAGRHQFYTVRIEHERAMPAFKASGDITSMSRADGYIEIPTEVEVVEAGTMVDVRMF